MESQKMSSRRMHRFLPTLRLATRVVLAGIFVVAGAAKAYDPAGFAIEIQRYQLVPWLVGAIVATYLPWLEMIAGAMLFVGRLERGALLILTLLLVIFTCALASAMIRGLGIDCGCFGKTFQATGTLVPFLRNIFLLACAAVLWSERSEGA
jgi:putative oxidoreductase